MSLSKLCLFTGAGLSLLMALFHMQFYKLFSWKEEFRKISLRNQKIFYSIHVALILLFLFFTVISIIYADQLSRARDLSSGIVTGYALFWLWRTIWQVLYFKSTGKVKALLIRHYVLTAVFFLLFISYSLPVMITLLKLQ